MKTRRILVLFAVLLASLSSVAQGFAGHIVDGLGEPVEGATIMELSTLTGSVSKPDGAFAIRYSGRYPTRVVVRCLGFRPDTLSIPSQSRDIRIVIHAQDVQGQEVNVVGHKRDVGFEKIDAKVAQTMVSTDAGIEAVLKSQMGVSSNSELSSQYRVRGGSFDENLVYVNGIEIYRPFLIRSGEQEGLSFVNPDMVSVVNFSAGGFDASYGDKLSSVLDVQYKRPTEFHASARASLLGGQLHAEGAAVSGKLTHITGLRYKTNQYLFGSLDTKGDYSPKFFDVQTYWSLTPNPKTSIGILAYYAQNTYFFYPSDRETSFGTISDARKLTIYFDGGERDRYRTCVVAADARQVVSPRLSFGLTASMFRTEEEEKYDILGEYWLQQAMATQTSEAVDQSQNIGVGGYMQHARNYLFGEVYSVAASAHLKRSFHNMDMQVKVTRDHYSDLTDEWAYTDSAGYISSPASGSLMMDELAQADNTLRQTRAEAFYRSAVNDIPIGDGRARLIAGFRLAYQNTGRDLICGPRVTFNYQIKKWSLRLSWGRYCQLPTLREMKRRDASLNRDVAPQTSWQIFAGADRYFGTDERPFKFTVEAYYKWLRNVNPYSIDNVRVRYEANNDAWGYAAGVDFKLNGQLIDGAESWATLSIMQTRENIYGDGHGSIPRPTDQRVQFSSVIQDNMPGNKSVSAMLSLFFGTGLPFGPHNCQRWQATSRMPGYKRVDLGLYKDFAIDADGQRKREHLRSARVGIEVFNLFDFANTISYFWVADTEGHNYGVPNYLTSRRINLKLSFEL